MKGVSELKKTRILFVCMGNICRSPTAEGVLRHMAKQRGRSNLIESASAGTHANHVGAAPDPRAQAIASARGYELGGQKARRLRTVDFETFDHVLAMDADNLAQLEAQCPLEHRQKLGLLMRYARRQTQVREVPDPYYGGPQGFEVVLDYIEDACEGLIDGLLAVPGTD